MKIFQFSICGPIVAIALMAAAGIPPVMCQSASNFELASRAQTVGDLQYVLGDNYGLFVAAYRLYLKVSCDYLAQKMLQDLGTYRLLAFCKVLNPCPVLRSSQSCSVQVVAYIIGSSCCTELTDLTSTDGRSLTTTPTTTPPWMYPTTNPPLMYVTAPSSFDLLEQQTCNYGRVLPSAKIYGGTEAIPDEFPWIAMLLSNGRFQCSATILDTRHVMTTAHCFDAHTESTRYEVIAGKFTSGLEVMDPGQQRVGVADFRKHEFYDVNSSKNDIAILKLAQPLVYTNSVMPACLSNVSGQLDALGTVAGWGLTEANRLPAVLMKVELQIYNNSQCYQQFKDTATDLQLYLYVGAICAANGNLGNKDSCKGDSGSPLMSLRKTSASSAWFVVGIVSNGNKCAVAGEPGIYVDIQKYLGWINSTIYSL